MSWPVTTAPDRGFRAVPPAKLKSAGGFRFPPRPFRRGFFFFRRDHDVAFVFRGSVAGFVRACGAAAHHHSGCALQSRWHAFQRHRDHQLDQLSSHGQFHNCHPEHHRENCGRQSSRAACPHHHQHPDDLLLGHSTTATGASSSKRRGRCPSSAQPLRVRDVRIAMPSNVAAADTGSGTSTPAQETDIVGLIADLGARPLKGPGYAAGRTAVVDALGALESASGSATDCVHVDGSSGPCGGTQPSFVDGDSPAGIVDGSNTSFTLSAVPDPASSLAVYRNGMLQKTGQDYTLTGQHDSVCRRRRAAAGRYLAGQLPPNGDGFGHAADLPQSPGAVQRDGRGHQRHQPHQHRNLRHPIGTPAARRPGGDPLRFRASGHGFGFQLRGPLGRDHHRASRRRRWGGARRRAGRCGPSGGRRAVELSIVGRAAPLQRHCGQRHRLLHQRLDHRFSRNAGANRRHSYAGQLHSACGSRNGPLWCAWVPQRPLLARSVARHHRWRYAELGSREQQLNSETASEPSRPLFRHWAGRHPPTAGYKGPGYRARSPARWGRRGTRTRSR